MTEDEQAALAYLKLQEDAKKLIQEVVLDLLMSETKLQEAILKLVFPHRS